MQRLPVVSQKVGEFPVNLKFLLEGEEEIGSPNFPQVVQRPDIQAALKKCVGVIIPLGSQSLDGSVEINLGAKGIVELELVSSGEKWGRGPSNDVHSSLFAQLDSPAWHLVQALNTLVEKDGHTPAVEGFFEKVRPLSPQLKKILEDAIPKRNEAGVKKALGVQHWFFENVRGTALTGPARNVIALDWDDTFTLRGATGEATFKVRELRLIAHIGGLIALELDNEFLNLTRGFKVEFALW